MPLPVKELDFYKNIVKDDAKEQQTKMLDLNQPDSVIAMYEGRLQGSSEFQENNIGDVLENYLFISTNTVLPTLFYQVPRPLIRAKREDLNYSAAVISALASFYLDDDWKNENQLAIIDAFLPYGFGVMKVGYNSRMGKAQAKPSLLTGTIKATNQANNIEDNPEFIRYEKPVFTRMSPKDTYLDSSKPFGKGQRITFKIQRTLQELIDSNLYNLSSNFLSYFKAKGSDEARKVKFDIYEHFCLKEGYCWKLVYTDNWHEELAWVRTPYRELPVSLLRFNKPPDVLYPVSHGNLAYKAQRELNYLNELWKSHVDKVRRQHLVWEDALTETGKATLRANEVDGIVTTNKPVSAGVYTQISSNPMGKDVYANIENVRGYLKLLLSTSGGRGGETDTEFAYTEKQQAAGDAMRMGGMQDSIRDFVRKQIRMLTANLVNLGDPEITIKITGKDVRDPVTGEVITGKEMLIGGPTGLNLSEEIKGDIEKDYIYDVDITSASRPDFAVIRKQLGDAIALSVNLKPLLQEKGKDLDIPEMVKDYFNTFDTIPNPDKYVIDMSEEDKMMRQQQQQMAMAAQMGQIKPPGPPNGAIPQEAAIQAGAESLGVPSA